MKIYLILLIAGFTSATLQEDFQNEANKAVAAFVSGLQAATPLHIALDVENTKDVQRLERDIKEELRKHIEEVFDKALKKIEDAIKNNKEVHKAALEYLKDLREKMKELSIQDHEVTEELEILKGKIDDTLRKILEKMGIFDKRSTDPEMPELLQGILGDVSIKELLLKVKKMILDTLNVKTIKDALAKIIGQATKKLCDWITTKGQEKVLDFFDGYLDSDSEKQKRNSEDRHREIKDYLKNIEENVDDKLAKFKKWLRDLLDKGVDESEEIFQKVVETIRKMIAEGKNVSRKGLGDILGLIREFEDKFGSLYDLRNIIKDFLRKKA